MEIPLPTISRDGHFDFEDLPWKDKPTEEMSAIEEHIRQAEMVILGGKLAALTLHHVAMPREIQISAEMMQIPFASRDPTRLGND